MRTLGKSLVRLRGIHTNIPQFSKGKPERGQLVTGWCWEYYNSRNLDGLCPNMFPDIGTQSKRNTKHIKQRGA